MASFSAAQRRQLADSGAAMPDGSYPIRNRADLDNAVQSIGRGSGSHAAIRAHIVKRAKALNLTDALPASWSARRGARQLMSGG
jgi:hypothetical protein